MARLAATNACGVMLFALVYAVAGARLVSQASFLACLALSFALVTAGWVRAERGHAALPALARLGRAAAGLVVVLLAVPVLILMPVFWLDTQLPEEAGLRRLLGPLMTLALVSLVLVVAANLVGAVVVAVRAARARARGAP